MQTGVFRTLKSLLAPLARQDRHASGASQSWDGFFEQETEPREAGGDDGLAEISVSSLGEISFKGGLDMWGRRAEPGPNAGRLQDHMVFQGAQGRVLEARPSRARRG